VSSSPTNIRPPTLRRALRDRRRAIPPLERQRTARLLAIHADRARLLRPGRRIALYLALPEEVATDPLIKRARARGCRIYLPRIVDTRRNRMVFVSADAPLKRGRWGILEPAASQRIPTRQLQVIFMPLVGFDAAGNRMGMGKGFYDRALSFRLRHPANRRPLLVGLAFSCQQTDDLAVRPHDVPLDMLITEHGIRRFAVRHPERPS
jgi:5-formyltetrahydrofolate cyclo-ligase